MKKQHTAPAGQYADIRAVALRRWNELSSETQGLMSKAVATEKVVVQIPVGHASRGNKYFRHLADDIFTLTDAGRDLVININYNLLYNDEETEKRYYGVE